MECSILFMGPVGSGKSAAVRSASEIEAVDTDYEATDETLRLKERTTVAMDMGVLHLDARDKIRLLGAPGQERFDFMWDILLEQARGVVLLLRHDAYDPLADLEHYMIALFRRWGRNRGPLPLVVGITHVDAMPQRPLDTYGRYLRSHPRWSGLPCVPVLRMDARDPGDVRAVLMTLAALMEIRSRLAVQAG